ncbi:MAG: hypothetical protein J6M22_05715 [Firmicutes bacterium]|nr:hypothetical protein [Bacillota bacterium]
MDTSATGTDQPPDPELHAASVRANNSAQSGITACKRPIADGTWKNFITLE